MFTDDANHMPYGCDEFTDAYSDYDIMNSRDYENLDTPDYESKPYGFGIERFEDPALQRANEAMWAMIDVRGDGKYTSAISCIETWGMFKGKYRGVRFTDQDMEFRNMCWDVWSQWDRRLWEHSQRIWEHLCDRCETHGEAIDAYNKWAKLNTKK